MPFSIDFLQNFRKILAHPRAPLPDCQEPWGDPLQVFPWWNSISPRNSVRALLKNEYNKFVIRKGNRWAMSSSSNNSKYKSFWTANQCIYQEESFLPAVSVPSTSNARNPQPDKLGKIFECIGVNQLLGLGVFFYLFVQKVVKNWCNFESVLNFCLKFKLSN